MLSKVEAKKENYGDSVELLNEIELIGKALYFDKNLGRTSFSSSSSAPNPRSEWMKKSQSLEPIRKHRNSNEDLLRDSRLFKDKEKSSNAKPIEGSSPGSGHTTLLNLLPKDSKIPLDPSRKEKKSSFWNWKPLKSFSDKNRRFRCCFQLHVHSIEGLPIGFKELSLCVHWKRREEDRVTRPVKVFDGSVEFEETLLLCCSVCATKSSTKSGPRNSVKYEAKHCLIHASVLGAPGVDLGKHQVDLTRLLPLTLEELEEEKRSGKWTTSFNLSGKAKGAKMNVSFGYMVLSDMKQNRKTDSKVSNHDQMDRMRLAESLPCLRLTRFMDDIKDLHEVFPSSKSDTGYTNMADEKSDIYTDDASTVSKPEPDVSIEHYEPIGRPSSVASESNEYIEKENEDNHSYVVEKGEELPSEEQIASSIEHYEPIGRPSNFASESNEYIEKENEDNHSYVVDKGEELPSEEQVTSEEVSMVSTVFKVESHQSVEINPDTGVTSEETYELHPLKEETCIIQEDELVVQDCSSKVDEQFSKESLMRDLELALEGITNLEAALDSPDPEDLEDDMEDKANHETNTKSRSLSLDELTESVASELFRMLGIDQTPSSLSSESEPESPRERLLRQFEKETLASGCSLFGFDMSDGEELECGFDISTSGNLSEGVDTPYVVQVAVQEHQMETNARIKMRAKVLEDLETEALMHEWGLNEKAFQHSPSGSMVGLGSQVKLPPGEPLALPLLGDGLGPILQTKDGGFLRSMNPSLFRNSNCGGSLIMQVSSPIVVPAEMGSGIVDILQRLASVGIENLSMQVNKLMPLEDITGKTMQQVAWEAASTLEGSERQYLLQHDSDVGQKKIKRSHAPRSNKLSSLSVNEMDLDYVSLEDLTPLAMDKIEELSIEGLKIQSGMSDEDAPSNISSQYIGGISALKVKGFGTSGSLGLEGIAGSQLLEIRGSGDNVDGLMGLSLTLDEWIRLDSGDIGDEDHPSERTFKILAAHHATSLDLIRRRSNGKKRQGKKCGLLGNNFTVGLMVQLRNPIRNYEPVGAPMLALIQVERVPVLPRPKIYCTISAALRNSNQEGDYTEPSLKGVEDIKEKISSQEEGIPQFRITEVHVAGLNTESGRTKLWGSTIQQQSGSRWLLANGIGKSIKLPMLKSPSTKVQPGDTLWSISSHIRGAGAKWKQSAAPNLHIRNPNVIFPHGTIMLP